MSTQHNGGKIGTLATPTHQEVQMVSCTVCRKVKGRAKLEVSTASATTVGSQVIRPSSVIQKVEKQKERERRETAKVGMTAKDWTVGKGWPAGMGAQFGTRLEAVRCSRDGNCRLRRKP